MFLSRHSEKQMINFPPSFWLYFLTLVALNNTKYESAMGNKIKLLGIVIFLIVIILGYSKKQQSKDLDTLLLDNVEASAAGEAEGDGECIGSGSIVCPFDNIEVSHVYIYYSLSR